MIPGKTVNFLNTLGKEISYTNRTSEQRQQHPQTSPHGGGCGKTIFYNEEFDPGSG